MAIDTREELIIALHRASEIEHALLVQYLFTGLSMKKRLSEGLTPRQQRLVREWQSAILLTARDEMGHLAIVCNLLAAIGAPARFDRPPMPRQVDFYPFPFDLLPFSDEALYRFLVFELPRGFPLPPPPEADLRHSPIAERAFMALAPDPLEYTFIGELYAQIADGFRNIAEKKLFIGPPEAQTANTWSDRRLDIRPATTRAEALAAIEDVIIDGEGSEAGRQSSHYSRFLSIRQAYFDEGRFAAARPLVRNPATRTDPGTSGPVTLIKDPTALRVAELLNSVYGLMLLLLQHYFSLAPKSGERGFAQRRGLQLATQRLMSVAVRPIAEELTLLPAGDAGDPARAGPPFEIYSGVSTLPHEPSRWIISLERLDEIIRECQGLGEQLPRIAELGETLSIMRSDLADALLPGEA